MGHKYYHDEPISSACYINQNGQIMRANHYCLLAADIFYNLGLVIFIILTTYHACEDGR
jgi:hypothetical protein